MTAASRKGHVPLEDGPQWAAEYAALRAHSGNFADAGLLGYTESNGLGLWAILEEGLPFAAYERLQAITSCTAREMALLLGVPQGALKSRKAAGRLTPRESDRLFRATRIVWVALNFCDGRLSTLRTWLRSGAAALGEKTPLEMMATDAGAQFILSWIGTSTRRCC